MQKPSFVESTIVGSGITKQENPSYRSVKQGYVVFFLIPF